MKDTGFLFHETFGASSRQWPEKYVRPTKEQTICRGCGITHPKIDDENGGHYHIHIVFGREVILECCGGFLDLLFAEHGEEFYQIISEGLLQKEDDSNASSP